MRLLEVKGVHFSYNGVPVLRGVDLDCWAGRLTGIIGPNGSGKTTLLRCISGLLPCGSGCVLLAGSPISGMSRKEIARWIAVVPQETSSAMGDFNVYNMVLMGRTPHIRPLQGETEEDLRAVENALSTMGIRHLAERHFSHLSGGEKQAVLVARALAQEPRLLLMDEPTSHLDIGHQLELLQMVKEIVTENNLAVVLVLHDLNLAARFCEELVLMNKGEIVMRGSAEQVITPELIRAVYNTDAEVFWHSGLNCPQVIPLTPEKEAPCR